MQFRRIHYSKLQQKMSVLNHFDVQLKMIDDEVIAISNKFVPIGCSKKTMGEENETLEIRLDIEFLAEVFLYRGLASFQLAGFTYNDAQRVMSYAWKMYMKKLEEAEKILNVFDQ